MKPVWQLAKETGAHHRPGRQYIAGVRGYYSAAQRPTSPPMPFNSSTAMYVDTTSRRVREGRARPGEAARHRVDGLHHRPHADPRVEGRRPPCASTSAWMTWIQLEEFAAIHNLPYATEADGYQRVSTPKLLFNSKPAFVAPAPASSSTCRRTASFKYTGRDSGARPDLLFRPGRRSAFGSSSGSRSDIVKNAQVPLAPKRCCPTDPSVNPQQNSNQLHHRRRQPLDDDLTEAAPPRNTRAWPKFFQFIGRARRRPPTWMPSTPATCRSPPAGYDELSKTAGLLHKEPRHRPAGRNSSRRGTLTPDTPAACASGAWPEIRNIVNTRKIEKAMQGQQTAQTSTRQRLRAAVTVCCATSRSPTKPDR